ncbi:MAG: EamA family transporter, partial [Chloroflexi bacterium]|nr:EamA family transporter [Chloroflexota bacterium]
IVYIVWGSTYLAIRYAVREGGGFPPFTLGALRVSIAGVILLIWGLLSKQRMRPSGKEWGTLILSALLLWVGGNGLVNWAEQRADSGLAALIIAATPIWVAIIESFLDRKKPSFRMMAALLIGFMGIAVLSVPVLISGVQADLSSVVGLLLAGISWGSGSIVQSRRPVQLAPQVNSAYQHLIGSLGLAGMAWLLQEPRPTPSQDAWIALAYLVIFGSVISFTAYVTALKQLPTQIVMTYAYVNPAIAVFLGWIFLREPITAWTIGGAALILFGVAGIFRERYQFNDSQSIAVDV